MDIINYDSTELSQKFFNTPSNVGGGLDTTFIKYDPSNVFINEYKAGLKQYKSAGGRLIVHKGGHTWGSTGQTLTVLQPTHGGEAGVLQQFETPSAYLFKAEQNKQIGVVDPNLPRGGSMMRVVDTENTADPRSYNVNFPWTSGGVIAPAGKAGPAQGPGDGGPPGFGGGRYDNPDDDEDKPLVNISTQTDGALSVDNGVQTDPKVTNTTSQEIQTDENSNMIDTLQNAVNNLSEQLFLAQRRIRQIQDQYGSSNTELKRQLETYRQEMKDIMALNSTLETELDNARAKLATINEKLQQTTAELEKLRRESGSSSDTISMKKHRLLMKAKEEELQALNAERERMRNELTGYQAEVYKLKEEFAAKEEKLKVEIQKLAEENDGLKQFPASPAESSGNNPFQGGGRDSAGPSETQYVAEREFIWAVHEELNRVLLNNPGQVFTYEGKNISIDQIKDILQEMYDMAVEDPDTMMAYRGLMKDFKKITKSKTRSFMPRLMKFLNELFESYVLFTELN